MAVSKEQQHTFEKLVKGRKKERDNMFRKTTAFQNAKVKGESRIRGAGADCALLFLWLVAFAVSQPHPTPRAPYMFAMSYLLYFTIQLPCLLYLPMPSPPCSVDYGGKREDGNAKGACKTGDRNEEGPESALPNVSPQSRSPVQARPERSCARPACQGPAFRRGVGD